MRHIQARVRIISSNEAVFDLFVDEGDTDEDIDELVAEAAAEHIQTTWEEIGDDE